MHEGAVCTEIIDIVSREAGANGINRVDEILLAIGPYSCLNPGQLNFYFEVAREGTCMAEAVIRTERDESLKGASQMYIREIRGE